MTRPTRRRLLQGLSSSGIVLTTTQWTDRSGATRQQSDTQSALDVSIAETNAPAPAGEYLQVTTELENTGSEDVRPETALLVGSDEEEITRIETTVEAGETSTIQQGFYTYPVPQDDEFTIRVEAGDEFAEETVDVTAATELPAARPDGELAVQPGAGVLFEAEAVDPDESQTTIWWVDGERESGGIGGAWESTYYAEVGADFWWHEFDASGTHEVTAAVLSQRDTTGDPAPETETYIARWQVDATDDGAASPSVEGVRPPESTVSVSESEPTEFELEATDPDGGLDRVVWWLTPADTILDVTELEGEADTATLSTDGGCHTCHVVPWVICTDGTATALSSRWELDAMGGGDDGNDDGEIELSIQDTNSPVDAGEFLEVTATAENTSSATRTVSVELVVGHDPTSVASGSVTLDPDESETVMLGYETYPTNQDEQFPVRVESDDDTDETTVEVLA